MRTAQGDYMKIDEKASFVHFVYPVLFEPLKFDRHVGAVKTAVWGSGEKASLVWDSQEFPKEDLLSHVANYLNPRDEHAAPTARMWELNHELLQSHVFGIGNKADWVMTSPQGEIPFRIEGIWLTLFRVGVGFMTVRANPLSGELNAWYDFLHSFRFIQGQRRVGVRGQRRTGFDKETKKPTVSPFFPHPAGGVETHPEGTGTLGEVIDALLRTGATSRDGSVWWREVFVPGQLLPFVSLYVDGQPPEKDPLVLYKVRNFFSSRQESAPSHSDLQPDHPTLLPYADRQWFVATLEGGGFVACDAPRTDFFRTQMPDHLAKPYFLLFLLTLQQRFALMMFSEEVSQHWLVAEEEGRDQKREAAFEHIRDLLLLFTARGLFTQVMQREHHHRCYEKWQQIFQVERLYQEVSDEVREMYNVVQLKRAERLQKLQEEEAERTKKLEERISMLGILIGVPAIILSFLGVNLQNFTNPEGISIVTALLIVIGGGGIVSSIVLWLLRRQMKKEGTRRK